MKTKHNTSKKRQAILDMLCSTKEHPSAEMIYNSLKEEIPSLSLGTVYRNLAVLQEEGLVISVGNMAGHERYDGNTNPHPHFMCRACHGVTDLDLPDTVSGLCQFIDRCGNTVDTYQLSFYGLCCECRNQ